MAIAELDRAIDEEAGALAEIFECEPYDLRRALKATPPVVVLRTASRPQAERALAALHARRGRGLLVDVGDVVPTAKMVQVHRFEVDDAVLRATERGPSVRWDDLTALIHVVAATPIERTTVEREVETTGRGQVTVDRPRTRSEREQASSLYLFGRGLPLPWVLDAHRARYLALRPMRATSHENFAAALSLFRSRAPRAAFDDRFARKPLSRLDAVQVRGHESAAIPPPSPSIDLSIHLLARWLTEPNGDPYRDARSGGEGRDGSD